MNAPSGIASPSARAFFDWLRLVRLPPEGRWRLAPGIYAVLSPMPASVDCHMIALDKDVQTSYSRQRPRDCCQCRGWISNALERFSSDGVKWNAASRRYLQRARNPLLRQELCSPDGLNQRHVNPEYCLYQAYTHRTVEGNRTRKRLITKNGDLSLLFICRVWLQTLEVN
jgi:hypothetical protein